MQLIFVKKILFLIYFHTCWKKIFVQCGTPSKEQVEHPFRHLSQWLQYAYPEMKALKQKQLSRGITLLASSQKTWKSVDGLAHEISARVSSTSASTRDLERIRAEAALDSKKKELLSELVLQLRLIQAALCSAEVAEITLAGASVEDDKHKAVQYAKEAGLGQPVLSVTATIPVHSTSVFNNSSKPVADDLNNDRRVQCLVFQDEEKEKIVISIGDCLDGKDMLALARIVPERLFLQPKSSMHPSEAIHIHRPLLDTAEKIIAQIGPNITEYLKEHKSASIQCVGYSFGGAVASLVSGILQGSLNSPDLLKSSSSCVGVASSRLTCTTFGSPPCISRNFKCNDWLVSFILGDDLVPRLSGKALFKLKARLAKAVPSSSNIFSQGLTFGSGLFRDTISVGAHGAKNYFMGDEMESSIAVPGRVYYLKPRRYQQGTSLNEVKGNMREDVIWQLDDIFLSKSMLKHHLLSSYIKILDRV